VWRRDERDGVTSVTASAWESSPLVVGHRGGRGNGWPPENTLASFGQARAEGARAIELDVRSCAGRGVVVFHDDTLTRMTRGRDSRRVRDVPEEELVRIDLGQGATVPSLREVLAWARREGVAVNVEMKHDVPRRRGLARDTIAIIQASGADVLLSSFDPLLLALAAAHAPSTRRALLTQHGQPRWAAALQEAMRPSLVTALHLELAQATPVALARYCRRGLRVGVWTVNDPAEARELIRLGAASIITDHPGEIREALARR
jgi:glycerophosphoryl diester phosphodiesterase